jgi:hypothetical protein
MNTEWEFLDHLHNLGRRAADDWLAVNFERLGKRSSVNVRGLFCMDTPENDSTPSIYDDRRNGKIGRHCFLNPSIER